MLSKDEMNKLMEMLASDDNIPFDSDLCEDISEIAYCVDCFQVDDYCEISRHIDIELSFGEYYEIQEGDVLYETIFSLDSVRDSNLQAIEKETRILLYSADSPL